MNHFLKYFLLIALFLAAPGLCAQNTAPYLQFFDQLPEPNGPVRCITKDTLTNTLYLSGDFSTVNGFNRSGGAFLLTNNGEPRTNFPKIDGTVMSSLPDGKGGWYIGGDFTRVGDKARYDLAQVDSSGQVTDFFEGMKTDGHIKALCRNNSSLYFGGQFRTVGKSVSGYGDVLSTITSGSALNLDGFNGPIYCASSDSAGGWYVGGIFTLAGGKPRTNLAHIQADGSIGDWAPFVSDTVFALAYDKIRELVWAGGAFNYYYKWSPVTLYSAQPEHLVKIVAANMGSSGKVYPSGYQVKGNVYCIYIAPDYYPGNKINEIFVGGNFVTKNSYPVPGFSLFSFSDTLYATLDIQWYELYLACGPGCNTIYTIFVHPLYPEKVFVGGDFFYDWYDPERKNLAVLNRNGSLDPWNPCPNGAVRSITCNLQSTSDPNSTSIYFAGDFTQIGGVPWCSYPVAVLRNRLFSIDHPLQLNISAWNPDADGSILSMAFVNDKMIVGGTFGSIGGQTRRHLAQLDLSGVVTAWDPGPDSLVYTVAITKGHVFTGGRFSCLSNLSARRNNLGAINMNSGILEDWNPGTSLGTLYRSYQVYPTFPPRTRTFPIGFSDYVSDLKITGNAVYIGGKFNTVGGLGRNNLARVDALSGNTDAWNPSPDGEIEGMIAKSDRLYVYGWFSSIGGSLRAGLAALHSSTAVALNWNPGNGTINFKGVINTMAEKGNRIFIGGSFKISTALQYLAAIDTQTATFTNPLQSTPEIPSQISIAGNDLYVAGGFSNPVDPTSLMFGLKRFNLSTGIADAWLTQANGEVTTLSPAGNTIFAGGRFTSTGGLHRRNAFAFNSTTGQILAWNPAPDFPPDVLKFHNGTLYAGGRFSEIGGKMRKGLAALDPVTGMAGNWNPGHASTWQVNAIEPYGNTVYVGGDFDSLGGSGRRNLAAVDASSGTADAWNPAPDAVITSFAMVDNMLYTAGNYTHISGISRNGFSAFQLPGQALSSWEFTEPLAINGTFVHNMVRSLNDSGIALIRNYGPYSTLHSGYPYPNTYEVNHSGRSTVRLYGGNFFGGYNGRILVRDVVQSGLTGITGGDQTYSSSNNTYYVQEQQYIKHLDLNQSNLAGDTDGPVNDLLLHGDTLYAGGEFKSLGDHARLNFAALIPKADTCLIRPVKPSVYFTGSLCYGDSVHLVCHTILPLGYHWSGPNGFSSTQRTPVLYNFNEQNAGEYTCWLALPNGCKSEDTKIFLPLKGRPPVAISNQPCPGDSLQLLTPGMLPVTYAWTGPNGFSSSLPQTGLGQIQLSDSGNYVISTTESGCPTRSDTVHLRFAPTALLNQTLHARVCSGQNAYFTVEAAGNALSYQWQVYLNGWQNLSDNETYSGTGNPTLVVLAHDSMYCQHFRCVISSGCYPTVYSDSATLKLGVLYPGMSTDTATCLPSARILSVSTNTLCINDSLTLNYLFGGGVDCRTDSIFAELSDSSGQFTNPCIIGRKAFDLNGTISASIPCGLPNSTAYRVRIMYTGQTLPGPDNGSDISISACMPSVFSISSNSPVCSGGTLLLHSSAQNNYQWSFAGLPLSNLQHPVLPNVPAQASGYYKLEVDWACGTQRDSLRVDIIPKPSIYAPYPAAGPGGTPVYLNASGLNPVAGNNTVYFGKALGSIVEIDTNHVLLMAPVNGSYGPITLIDKQCGLSSESIEPYFVTDGCPKPLSSSGTFNSPVSFNLGATAAYVRSATGDIDGDGKLDIIVRNGNPGGVQILRNNSTTGNINASSFLPAVSFIPVPVLQGNEEIIVHDFDNDGKQDVLCTSSVYPFQWLWANTASPGLINTSSLATPFSFGTGIGGATGLATGDLNLDGKSDIISGDLLQNTIWIYPNSSVPGSLNPGSFNNTYFIIATASRPTKALAIADINADGFPDIVQLCSNGKICVYTGYGAFGFQPPVEFTTLPNAGTLAVADLDKDLKPEIIVGYGPAANGISYWRNTSLFGVLGLGSRMDMSTSVPAARISIADINGDGKADLLSANNNTSNTGNTFSAWPNTSVAPFITFSAVVNFNTSAGPHLIQVADFDSSGSKDVLISYIGNTSVQVLRNLTTPTNIPTITASGPVTFCNGDSVTLTASPAFSYQWNTGATTQSITVSNSGQYWVTANSCEKSLITAVSEKNYPVPFTVSGAGTLCSPGPGLTVTLSGSQTGTYYRLYHQSIATSDSLPGSGAALHFSNLSTEGIYKIMARTDSSSCPTWMNDSAQLQIQVSPAVYTVYGGGNFCTPTDSGVIIRLSGSENGVSYQLVLNDSVPTGIALSGTGNPLSYPVNNTSGIYTVRAEMNGCMRTMDGSTFITANSDPQVFSLSGGGNFCSSADSGVQIHLDSSLYDHSYTLYRDAQPLSPSTLQGNNSPLIFYAVTDSGIYTVKATSNFSGCSAFMNDSVAVSITQSTRFYPDLDGDGYGDEFNFIDTCLTTLAGYINTGGDCDDSDSSTYFLQTEICYNDKDDNCNGYTDENCYAFLNLRVFIEGFYLGNGSMLAVADPLNLPGICDTITLSLADSATYAIVYTDTAVIDTSGFGLFRFPLTFTNTPYYLVVKHRNALETWSKTPLVPGQISHFDFSTSSGTLKMMKNEFIQPAPQRRLYKN